MGTGGALRMGMALPCSVCGSSDLQFKNMSSDGLWWIHCDSCGHAGPQDNSPSDAGERWNAESRSRNRDIDDE